MGLDSIVRSGVAIAAKVTASLLVTVLHEPWSSSDSYNQHRYGASEDVAALVEWKPRLVKGQDGKETLSTCAVTFLQDIELDLRDRITLPDGSTSPILSFEGLVDPVTNRGYVTTVYLGS